jgi:3-deoxy-7-phosphoheptulonate synthase
MSLPQVQNVNVLSVERLPSPSDLKKELPATELHLKRIVESRQTVQRILLQQDKRMLFIVGPCSIHDPAGALDYARRLSVLREELQDRLYIVMRVYFEKPRTTIGWKGLIYDPHLDGSSDISTGLRRARALLLEINSLGLPTATEFLDPIVPQYISGLISWAAIGARTTESQTHRQMASGLSMPVGFKNGTDGGLQVAIDAMGAAMNQHSFVGIDPEGFTSIVRTNGNPWGHIVLRGGHKRTNYDPDSIQETVDRLSQAGLSQVVTVDCSHANSNKVPARQSDVCLSVVNQRVQGNANLIGLMLESYLEEGSQKIPEDQSTLRYGQSVTDPCMNWADTEKLLRQTYQKLEPLFTN